MKRPGLSTVQLLGVLALLAIFVGIMIMALATARRSARDMAAMNNLQNIGLATLLYQSDFGHFPSGNDHNNFSALAHMREYLDLQNVEIDFKKPVDDPANDAARQVPVRLFMNERDPVAVARKGMASSFMFNAGTKPGLKDNDGVFYQDSRVILGDISNADGVANTVAIVENLIGDGGRKAVDPRRQHVVLNVEHLRPKLPPLALTEKELAARIADLDDKDFQVRAKTSEELEKLGAAILPALKKALADKPTLELRQRVEALVKKAEASLEVFKHLKDDTGLADWKADRHIAGNRGASWLDGRFLQTTFTATRPINDERPDVSVAGLGGLSSIRSLDGRIRVVFCDRHAQILPANIDFKIWKAIMTRAGGEDVTLP